MRTNIAELLNAHSGVIARRRHPEIAGALAWAVRNRELVAVLPGVYALPSTSRTFETRVRAARLWDPDALLIGSTAARMTFWPQLQTDLVELACGQHTIDPPGYALTRRQVHPDLIVDRAGWRMTDPSLTALDLCATHGGNAIDVALRTRAATLQRMHDALSLSSGRRGNGVRRAILLDSRDAPWSEAERLAHRLFRQADITGWVSNLGVAVQGRIYYVDVAFEELKPAIEIDGRIHEDDFHQFEADRWRQNALVLEGWRVLRFTWPMLRDHPREVVRAVSEALAPQSLTLVASRRSPSRSAGAGASRRV